MILSQISDVACHRATLFVQLFVLLAESSHLRVEGDLLMLGLLHCRRCLLELRAQLLSALFRFDTCGFAALEFRACRAPLGFVSIDGEA